MRRSGVLALAIVVAVVVAVEMSAPESDRAEAHHLRERASHSDRFRPGCQRHYPTRRFYTYTRARYAKRKRPLTAGQVKYARHVRLCLDNEAKSRRAYRWQRQARARFRARHHWRWAFYRMPGYEQAWAWSTSSCESGYDPGAHDPSGTYHGAFQFSLETAAAAGFAGDPHVTSWHEQAVRAIRWKWRTSDEQWPVCGD